MNGDTNRTWIVGHIDVLTDVSTDRNTIDYESLDISILYKFKLDFYKPSCILVPDFFGIYMFLL